MAAPRVFVSSTTQTLPGNYGEFLTNLKQKIRSTQLKAAVSVNSEMILLYWDIGRQILARQDNEGWGTRIVDRLSTDLRRSFPDLKGFSSRNL